MRLYRIFKILFILISVCLFGYITYQWLKEPPVVYYFERNGVVIKHRNAREDNPVILWWTPIVKNYQSTKQCGFHECIFTVNRNLLVSSKMIIFYGSDLNKTDLPIPRLSNQIWGLLHEESPKNVPYISHDNVLKHFNFTSTFSRFSSFPISMQYLKSIKMLTSPEYIVPIGSKSLLRVEEKLASVVFLQSICDTMTGRDEYVKELMEYIDIDSYGGCLHNKDLPKELSTDYLNKLDSPELYKFLARYKFIISYENGVCKDYISEKFWRPLIVGSIPVYFGCPTVRDWEPNTKSVIHIEDFSSPQLLAEFLKKIDKNDTEYNSYLDHKYNMINPIKNQRLLDIMYERDLSADDNDNKNIFDEFECFICNQVHNIAANLNIEQKLITADKSHYDCPTILTYPPMKSKMNNNVWNSIMAIGICQANILDSFLKKNINYTQKQFDDLLTLDVKTNKCNY